MGPQCARMRIFCRGVEDLVLELYWFMNYFLIFTCLEV